MGTPPGRPCGTIRGPAPRRPGDAVDRVLTDALYDLEDYTADPNLREPGDLSDGELTSRIRAALDELGPAGGP